MRAAASLDDYVANWRDSYVVDKTFCAFHAGPDLFGVIVWGHPDVNQGRAITHARGAELADPGTHRVILDYRLLETVDPDAFAVVGAWLDQNRDSLAARTQRVALIPPVAPYPAAVVSGFYNVVAPPYPSQLCASLDDAEAWLGAPTRDAITQVLALCGAGRALTSQLVRVLDRDPTLSVDDAARELGMTSRTLQRRLQEEGTTFRAESRKAIVRRAKNLLSTTDDKIADIAAAVGCASAQHFTDLFRAEVGEPPAAWRARSRG